MTEVAHPSRRRGEHRPDASATLAAINPRPPALDLVERLGRVGHWRVSLPDYAMTWSAELYRIHGVTPAQYRPDLQTASDFYHPDDRQAVKAAVTAAAQDGEPFEFALRLVRAGGEIRHVKVRGEAIAASDKARAQLFGVFIDVTDQQKTEDELRDANLKLGQIAHMDALTLLANRRQFDEIMAREWRRAIREQTPLSLIMLDIDRFKAFNDLYGHLAGDECLRAVATALTPIVRRPGDLVARYGGEEFALILPVTEAAGADTIARNVRAAIAALGLIHAGNPACGSVVTASLGVSTVYPQAGTVHDAWLDLIAETDGLLYEAKRTGRNRVVSLSSVAGIDADPQAANEAARLLALEAYERAGATRRTAEMDRIAQLAATLTSSPIGLVSLVGRDEQRFAGNFGLQGVEGTGRDVSFCVHTIMGDDPFVVADATRDPRFQHNALVTGDPSIRYYAGAPIISETTGYRLGALCIIDKSARPETSQAVRALLTDLAKMVAKLLEEKLTSAAKPAPPS